MLDGELRRRFQQQRESDEVTSNDNNMAVELSSKQTFELISFAGPQMPSPTSTSRLAHNHTEDSNGEPDEPSEIHSLLKKEMEGTMSTSFQNPNFDTGDKTKNQTVRWKDSNEDDVIVSTPEGHQLLEQQGSDDEDGQSTAGADLLKRGPDIEFEDESSWRILSQVVGPFFIAGSGMVCAGVLLDIVQHWPVFTRVSEIFILVPALLGLKGNLEMTLASRLSTLANMGMMDTSANRNRVIASNLALIQAQACVVALFASLFAITLAWIPRGDIDLGHALLLCASSMTTAALASLVLGLIMVGVIMLSRRYNVNPDNVATPIAASLGDLTTLGVLALFGTMFLWCKQHDMGYVNALVVLLFVLTTPFFMYLSAKDPHTKIVLEEGWTPVLAAMMISSAGGFILKQAVRMFVGIAVFQPVINGVGGNLVAVQASRIGTSLHMGPVRMGSLPGNHQPAAYCNPVRAFFGKELDARAARVLLAMTVPGHLVFNALITVIGAGHQSPWSPAFLTVYLMAAFLQVAVLLFICQWIVHKMWFMHIDPDNSAIPYLTALGDLIGTTLLALAFATLAALKPEVSMDTPEIAPNSTLI